MVAKKVYDSYRKTWFYEQNGVLTLEPPPEPKAEAPKAVAPKAEAPKKKWYEFWK